MTAFNIQKFRAQLGDTELGAWFDSLLPQVHDRLRPDSQRNFPGWLQALESIPSMANPATDLDRDAICASTPDPLDQQQLKTALMRLSPWRKGPFELHGVYIDCEWRSDFKWQRIAAHINLRGKTVLDVGSGNGYYSLRMLGAGAQAVIGLDTSLLFCTQFQAVSRLTGEHRATVLPISVEVLADHPHQFECIFSMGVLYHRRQPLEHLRLLHHSLAEGGELVLETLILHGHSSAELVPPARYANMRNVWSVPSMPLLMDQLKSAGFSGARCVDITRTTVSEQRPTEWMQFNSLPDALDPADPNRTIEGHPGLLRAVIIARK